MMEASVVNAILREVRACWPMANDIEITLEANPTSVEADRFSGYRDAGVNRVSMGVQALNDPDLKALGRLHSADEAMAAFDVARGVFDRVSFDLIYARQNQTEAAWEAELQRALSLAVDHLSLYQLTIEDGTAFGDRYAVGKLRGLPDEDRATTMFEMTQEICKAAGFAAYEVSNHAKPCQESRHNLIYWHYGDYVGIGPGAHGRVTLGHRKFATEAPLGPFDWLKAVRDGSGESSRVELTLDDQRSEFFLMGLRVVEGIARDRIDFYQNDKISKNINILYEMGLVEFTPTHLRLTPKGRPLLNAVLAELLRD